MPSEAQSRGDSSATAKVPPTLPNEIWLHIADMVDSNDLKKLIGEQGIIVVVAWGPEP